MNIIPFEKDKVPVSGRCQVLVAGGGTAGVVAGISAARQGADTLIVEQFGALGGSQTMALVTPVMHTHMDGDPQSSAIAEEMRARLIAEGASLPAEQGKGWFDPTALKFVMEDMVNESGCRVLYHTTLIGVIKDDSRVTHAVVFNTDGITAIEAGAFVDATADGVLSVMGGAGFDSGNEEGFNQAVSLRFIMSGVDVARTAEYVRSLGEERARDYPAFSTASVNGMDRFRLNPIFYKAYEDGLLTLQDIKYFQCFTMPGRPGCMAFNCPELGSRENVLDPGFLSQRQMAGKQSIRRLAKFLKERIPGFENAYVTEVAPMMGIREGRRIRCEYTLAAQDIAGYAKQDDYIASSNYPVDIHDAGDTGLKFAEVPDNLHYYHIPYRSLVVRNLDNVLVAGRCLGADFIAQSTVRVQASCRATGEAAGIAAAMMVSRGCPARAIDGSDVRQVMLDRGAQFEPIK